MHNQTRLLNTVVDDVFVQPYLQQVTNSDRIPTTPPSLQRPRGRRSSTSNNVSPLNGDSPQRIATVFPQMQMDSPNSDNNSPISNFFNTSPSRSSGDSRSLFEGGKRKTKKGRNKKTKRKSNQPLKKIEPKIKRGSCKGRSPCNKSNKNKHK